MLILEKGESGYLCLHAKLERFCFALWQDFVCFMDALLSTNVQLPAGQGFQPRLKAADVTPNRGTKMRNFAFPGPEVLESSSGASLEDIPEQDLFQVHWPPALGAREGLAPESTVDKIELTDQGSKGVHACDDGGRKLKSPELRDIPGELPVVVCQSSAAVDRYYGSVRQKSAALSVLM